MNVPSLLNAISQQLKEQHAKAILVGGAVRDMLMQREVKDFDVEVYGLDSFDTLESLLKPFGSVSQVGKNFGVVKLQTDTEEYDFSFPRTEEKTGKGHRGFRVRVDGSLDFATAARRRDFTLNAMGLDIESGEIIDPYGGLQDIQNRVLRHIDDVTFAEDPLRVYRAVQFAARFGLEVAPQTAALCKRMVAEGMLDELPRERIWEEWKKLLLKAPKPSVGFELMREWGITEHYFPELHALIDCPQDPTWHPEGDVWVHTMLAVDAMASIVRSEERGERSEKEKLKLLFAILCHDLGKPLTTTLELDNKEIIKRQQIAKESFLQEKHTKTPHSSLLTPHSKKVHAIGHEKAGLESARSLLYRLTHEHSFIESILPLVEHHLKPSQFYAQGAKSGAIRRLSTKVNIKELVSVAKADFLGRTTPEAQQGTYEAGEWLLDRAKALSVQKEPLKPLIGGRDLIALGLQPSPKFKAILDDVYQKQMDGVFESRENALSYVKQGYSQISK